MENPRNFNPTSPMSYLKLSAVEKHYESFHALKNINFSVEKEEFVIFVGPSGCGKSTLLRSGVVNIVEHLGSETFIHSSVGDSGLVVAKTSGSVAPERNTRLQLYFPLEHLYLFNDNEQAIAARPAA
jgi:ABC-type sugar transport system ATPase subunit